MGIGDWFKSVKIKEINFSIVLISLIKDIISATDI